MDTSLLEADDMLVTCKFARLKLELALVKARLAMFKLELALVTANCATVTLENAEEVAILAFRTTTARVEEATPCADLMPLVAEIDAC